MPPTRRTFLKTATLAAASGLLPSPEVFRASQSMPARPVRVVVWDEQQPEQKPAYENFIGNHLAKHLQKQPGFSVRAEALDDPDQGLSDGILNTCDVLIW